MRGQSNWFRVVRRKFSRKSGHQRDIVVFNNASHSEEESVEENADLLNAANVYTASSRIRVLYSEEDIAAMTIQAYFRGHLARRAFRALRSLVKLQAMVRGAYVRKQARIALHCMHAMVRLQVTVRARQLLG